MDHTVRKRHIMSETLNKTNDLYELPNGAILSYNGSTYMKIKTEKTRYGNPENILVFNTETDEKKEIRSPTQDQVIMTDPNPIAFGGNTDHVSEITHKQTDKSWLKTYLQEHYR